MQAFKGQTYPAKIGDSTYNVTMDEVHLLRKGKVGMVLAVKGGYFFLAKTDNENPAQSLPNCAAGLAIGFYWAVGPDAS